MRPGRKLKVIVTRRLPREIEARMMELFDTRLNEDDRPLDRAAMAQAVAEADVLVPTVTDTIDADLIGQAGPDLKLIASFGTGVDHIDLAAARQREILVTNTPGVLTEDTADMTMALISRCRAGSPRASGCCAAATGRDGRRPPCWGTGSGASASASSAWGGSARRWRAGRGVSASPSTTTTATASTTRPKPSSRRRGGRAWIRCWRIWTSFRSTARARRRPITCCRPGGSACCARKPTSSTPREATPSTRRPWCACWKPAESRAPGSDVYENEPVVTPKLLTLDNVVALPHIGSATIEGRRDMGEKVLINIQTFADGHNPPDRVIDPAD